MAISLARVFLKEASSHLRETEVNTPHFCQSISVASTIVFVNLFVDMTYAYLDPRIRYQ
jgi:hypothetical protein